MSDISFQSINHMMTPSMNSEQSKILTTKAMEPPVSKNGDDIEWQVKILQNALDKANAVRMQLGDSDEKLVAEKTFQQALRAISAISIPLSAEQRNFLEKTLTAINDKSAMPLPYGVNKGDLQAKQKEFKIEQQLKEFRFALESGALFIEKGPASQQERDSVKTQLYSIYAPYFNQWDMYPSAAVNYLHDVFEMAIGGHKPNLRPLDPEEVDGFVSELSLELKRKPPEPTIYTSGMSDAELWAHAADSIDSIGVGYLNVYEKCVAKYVEFFESYTRQVRAVLSVTIESSGDKGDILIDKDGINNCIQQLYDAWVYQAMDIHQSVNKTQFVKEFNKAFVLDGSNLIIALDPLVSMKNMTSGLARTISSAKYHSWQAGFDAEEEKLKNRLQSLTQKYSHANSLYDNLVKVLSSTISACMEAAKSYFHT